jgi:hypothetical protein
MINVLQQSLWKQFGASIDMLKNAIEQWPEALWESERRFYYMAYHTVVFLDYYLTMPAGAFVSPLPFTISATGRLPEGAIDDVLPNRIYSKAELLDYLQASREKCRRVLADLMDERVTQRWVEVGGDMDYSVLELLLYNMRHVQHHTAQLNLLLRQRTGDAPGWVARVED